RRERAEALTLRVSRRQPTGPKTASSYVMRGDRVTCDVLVRNAHVITMDDTRSVHAPGAVAISGRDIVAVGPERDVTTAYVGRRSIDADGSVVHPGFVDAHYHAT